MNSFYETNDGRIKIFHSDAICFLKTLPSNSVDLIMTDPAYNGLNQKQKWGNLNRLVGKYSEAGNEGARWFQEFDDSPENYIEFLTECSRVLKEDRHFYIMFDSYSLLTLGPLVRKIFNVKNIICWDKINIGLGYYFRRRHELIMFASKGKRALNTKSLPDVWRIKRVNGKYPTQKPTEVFQFMLKASSEKNYVVCDPFIGSGSSAIASIKEGCQFWGADISQRSLDMTQKRIEAYCDKHIDIYQPRSQIPNEIQS